VAESNVPDDVKAITVRSAMAQLRCHAAQHRLIDRLPVEAPDAYDPAHGCRCVVARFELARIIEEMARTSSDNHVCVSTPSRASGQLAATTESG